MVFGSPGGSTAESVMLKPLQHVQAGACFPPTLMKASCEFTSASMTGDGDIITAQLSNSLTGNIFGKVPFP